MATSYSNLGGTGSRTRRVVITQTILVSGSTSELLNGTYGNTFFFSPNGQAVAGLYLQFSFFTTTYGMMPVVIDEARWYQDTTSTHGSWKWQGSNDGSIWTDIGAAFTLGGATPFQTQSSLNGNTTAFLYYRLLGVSGTSSSTPWLREIEFRISGFNALGVTAPALPTGGSSSSPVPVASELKGGTTGTVYSETISANGGVSPYTFAITSGALPSGLSLSSSGSISGTPTATGANTFTVTVTDANANTGSQAFSITISTASTPTSGGNYGFFT